MIDFHTHKIKNATKSVLISEIESFQIPPSPHYFCLGIHPWCSESAEIHSLEELLKIYHQHPRFFGIGEIGLDKLNGPTFDIQLQLFEKQLELAKNLKINRIILHNVKTYSDTLELLLKVGYQGKVLLHDFRKNPKVAQQFSHHFETYLGVRSSAIAKLDEELLTLDQLMPETDDSQDDIQLIYKKLALKYSTPPKMLLKVMENNLNSWMS